MLVEKRIPLSSVLNVRVVSKLKFEFELVCSVRSFRLRTPSAQALAVWVTSISAEWMRLKHHNAQQAAAARQLLAAAPPVAAKDGSSPPPVAAGAGLGAPHAPPAEAQAHQLDSHLEAEDGSRSTDAPKDRTRRKSQKPPDGVPPGTADAGHGMRV